MKMKKIISAALAALMAVSALTTTSFAALKADSSISLKSTTVIPVLKVTLPKALTFVVNPYKMQLDVTTGKAPAATALEANIVKTQVVPVYGTVTTKDPDTGANVVTVNKAWSVLNESGIPISCMLYAQAASGNPTGPFEILDVNNSNKNAVTGAASDVKNRQLSLALMGKSSGGGNAVAIKFSSTAPTAWTVAGGCTQIASVPDKGTLDLTLDTTKSICAVGKSCEETLWTAKDTATINVFFKFDFVAA